jgi:UDP-N-acetylglucosamine--N-acetylmuramyl-(pentapeptide) pyrophosphoryl-undecaprenol N-acetylglucosamine transferase
MKIVLTGGGSAGHTVPHLALLPMLKKKFDNIYYIGSNGIEKEIISKQNIPFYEIKCPKLIRSLTLKNLTVPFNLLKSINSAKKILKQLQPDIVFSKGGYVALPVVYAAHSLKIPVVAHESDLSVGLANKLSSKYCETVFTSFFESSKKLKNGIYSGSPIREELFTTEKTSALQNFNFNKNKKVILVLGGGSGSLAINTCLRDSLPELLKKYNILHICGKNNLSNCDLKGYIEKEFITDMASAYAVTDYVISRAGSNTLFEIMLLKKPAVLIPLPKASSRGDQIENALYFESKGLCKVLVQENLNKESLISTIDLLNKDVDIKKNLNNGKIKSGNNIILQGIIKNIKPLNKYNNK